MKNILRRAARASCVAVGLLAVSCAEDENPSGPAEPEGPQAVAEVIAAYAQALHERDLEAYEALLEQDFEFCPAPNSLADYPWLMGRECWSREEEIDMIANMFDPAFVSPATGWAVHRIDSDLTLESSTWRDFVTVALCTASFVVLESEDSGLRSDTRLAFEIVPHVEGPRILSIEELPLLRGRDDLPELPVVPPPPTWASIKADYRSVRP